MLKRVPFILCRLLLFALAGYLSLELTRRFGPAVTIGLVAGLFAVICGSVALLMRRAPIGKVTYANYLAGFFLPFGYYIGKGKLLPIVVTSWLVWLAVGAAVAILSARGYDPRPAGADGHHHTTALAVLLWSSWIVDGAALLYLLKTLFTRLGLRSRAARTMFLTMSALVAMMLGGALLASQGRMAAAVLLAGGPIFFLGGSYGLFLAVILITKPRWN